MKDIAYYTFIQQFLQLRNLFNFDIDKHEYIYMYSFTSFCTEIFNKNMSFYYNKNNISLKILIDDNIKLNEKISIEMVFQTMVNPDNLPLDIEKLEIDNLSMTFNNLPHGIQIIKLLTEFSEEEIKKAFPKIPFGCKIIKCYGLEFQ